MPDATQVPEKLALIMTVHTTMPNSNREHYDVIVVGGGIVGMGCAYNAAKRGLRVALFESTPLASGASVRNFGMIWPIGQPAGDRYRLAIRNRDLWLEVAQRANIPIVQCGSLHLAHHDDELETLSEFALEFRDPEQEVRMLSAGETLRHTPAANPDGLRGALHSPDECRIDPRQATLALGNYLSQLPGVDCFYGTTITRVEADSVYAADHRRWTGDRIMICSGADLQRLCPELYIEAGLKRCKLQMLRTVAPQSDWKLGPHLASGLTLRHYEAFSKCPSQRRVRERYARNAPELDHFGIHVMLSQAIDGQIVLGDSHEYDDAIEPFDKEVIDSLILREIRKVFHLPNWEIEQRWSGIYAKHPSKPYWIGQHPNHPAVTAINGLGGAGMSLSLALTESIMEGKVEF